MIFGKMSISHRKNNFPTSDVEKYVLDFSDLVLQKIYIIKKHCHTESARLSTICSYTILHYFCRLI